jgi:hypothetical protein
LVLCSCTSISFLKKKLLHLLAHEWLEGEGWRLLINYCKGKKFIKVVHASVCTCPNQQWLPYNFCKGVVSREKKERCELGTICIWLQSWANEMCYMTTSLTPSSSLSLSSKNNYRGEVSLSPLQSVDLSGEYCLIFESRKQVWVFLPEQTTWLDMAHNFWILNFIDDNVIGMNGKHIIVII